MIFKNILNSRINFISKKNKLNYLGFYETTKLDCGVYSYYFYKKVI